MDLTALRTSVRRRANVPSTDGVWTDGFVDDALNEALVAIGLMQPWPWLETVHTEVGDDTGTVDLSAVTPPVRDIVSVHIGNFEGKPVSTGDIDSWLQNDRPGYIFATWGDSVLIRPEPAATDTISIRYYQNEPALTTGADTPVLPERYHLALAELACAYGFSSLDDDSSAMAHERRAMSTFDKMRANALRRARGPHSVRVRSGSQY